MKKLLLLVAFALALPAVAADADKKKKKKADAPPPPPTEEVYKTLDANKNGKLGQDEFFAQFLPAPTKKDKNPKPTKTREESNAQFAELDADKNKVLTLAEFKGGSTPTTPESSKKAAKKKAK